MIWRSGSGHADTKTVRETVIPLNQSMQRITVMSFKQTNVLNQVFERAQALAERQGYAQLTLDHLFWAVLDRDHSHATYLLRRTLRAWELSQMKQRVERELERKAYWQGKNRTDRPAQQEEKKQQLLLRMAAEVEAHGPSVLNTGHLLMVILRDRRSFGSRLLASRHVRPFEVKEILLDLPPNEDYYEEMRALEEWNPLPKSDRLRQTLESLQSEPGSSADRSPVGGKRHRLRRRRRSMACRLSGPI